MAGRHQDVFTVQWRDQVWEILEPTMEELQAFHVNARDLTAQRHAEIEAYFDQIRPRVTDFDRRLLGAARITVPESFR